jgi:hypothetical protein
MESIRNSMDPRAKEKHEEEHERIQERKARTNNHCMNSLKAIKQRN